MKRKIKDHQMHLQGGQKSKLLILSKYVDKTEKIGET